MKTGIELIQTEREEQIHKHGRTIMKDVAHNSNRIPPFNMLPLRVAAGRLMGVLSGVPYHPEWNPKLCGKMDNKTDIEKLVLAGAFIAAEIDRLQALEQ